MWQKAFKKTIFLLHVENYSQEILDITYPLIKHYARKIDADIYEIRERHFPEFPVVYEKLQIYELAQMMKNDWNFYIDSDCLVHPDLMDMTVYIPRDTVAHWGHDLAENRWKTDRYFWRDGRHVSSCNWFTVASDWCIDLWRPLDDLTMQEAIANIWPTMTELAAGIEPGHLIDDYVLSRNIARYGLKFTDFRKIFTNLGFPETAFLWDPDMMFMEEKEGKTQSPFVWHRYQIPNHEKVARMKGIVKSWGVKV